MSEHEPSIGASDEWYTAREVFKALDVVFDLDPCSPGPQHWVPARKVYTIVDDGLMQPWCGFVWMNPPFGGRNGQVPWLRKFFEHGDGIAMVAARTSAGWFHDWARKADCYVFPRGKSKFVKPDGAVGKSPGTGSVLLAAGARAYDVLDRFADRTDGLFLTGRR